MRPTPALGALVLLASCHAGAGGPCPPPCSHVEWLDSLCDTTGACSVAGTGSTGEPIVGCGQALEVDLAAASSTITRSGDFVLAVVVDVPATQVDDGTPSPGQNARATVDGVAVDQQFISDSQFPFALLLEIHSATARHVVVPFDCLQPKAATKVPIRFAVMPGPCYRASVCPE